MKMDDWVGQGAGRSKGLDRVSNPFLPWAGIGMLFLIVSG